MILPSPRESPPLPGLLSAGGRGVHHHQIGAIGILGIDGVSAGQEAGTDTSRSLLVEEGILHAGLHLRGHFNLSREVSVLTLIPIFQNGAGRLHRHDHVKGGALHHAQGALRHRSAEDHRLPHVASHPGPTRPRHATTLPYLVEEPEPVKSHQSGQSPDQGHLQLPGIGIRITTLWMDPSQFVGTMVIQIMCLVGEVAGHTTTIVATSEVVR